MERQYKGMVKEVRGQCKGMVQEWRGSVREWARKAIGQYKSIGK